MRFLIRILVNAVAVAVATWLLTGIEVNGSTTQQALTLVAVGAILGVINALVRPLVRLIALPLYVLTLGLITFVINALLLLLTSAIAGGLDLPFRVDGFWAAFWGAIIISVVSFLLSVIVPDKRDSVTR